MAGDDASGDDVAGEDAGGNGVASEDENCEEEVDTVG